MRRIRGDVRVEGLPAFRRFDPFHRLLEEEVGAVTLCFLKRAVVPNRGIEVRVAGRIAARTGIGLANPAAAMDVHLVVATAAGLVFGFVAEVPFAENAGG